MSFTLYPAIDLKDGQCVRLLRGEMDQATVFSDSPADQAKAFREAGFTHLHVVDLNGAFEGKAVNRAAVEAILKATDAPVQLGGGIRTRAQIDAWLEAGISRVILGTAALRDPELVKEAARALPGQVVVGIDAKDGMVAVEGWAETSDMKATELAKAFEGCGVAAIVATDIGRDGLKTGVNVPFTADLANTVSIPIIASGGVATLDDLAAFLAIESAGIEGVISGRALYDGRIDPAAALALLSKQPSGAA
jgi:phosphoribosylformimino-5-aminoimidazole carboxamide ribotide isomerase